MNDADVVVIGGTTGLGFEVARHYADAGRRVILTGRDPERAATAAAELGDRTVGLGFDLSEPAVIAPALAEVGRVDRLVLAGIDRDQNLVREYNPASAVRLVTQKLVGYTEVVHALSDRLHDDSSILIFGGLAKERPYPGSTTVTTVNHGVDGLVRAMSFELKPIRVNALHPGIVGDSPFWSGKTEALEAVRARAATGRWVTMADVVDAAVFLLENPSVSGTELRVDGGWSLPW
ncbi:MAG TPA: SDR family oxidoreductase [Actinomycetota bacterium]|nr:SDR family oxidoreductase [Actinomycetota bacterium]